MEKSKLSKLFCKDFGEELQQDFSKLITTIRKRGVLSVGLRNGNNLITKK